MPLCGMRLMAHTVRTFSLPRNAIRQLDKKRLDPLIEESLELTRMMGASVATARRKLEQEGGSEI